MKNVKYFLVSFVFFVAVIIFAYFDSRYTVSTESTEPIEILENNHSFLSNYRLAQNKQIEIELLLKDYYGNSVVSRIYRETKINRITKLEYVAEYNGVIVETMTYFISDHSAKLVWVGKNSVIEENLITNEIRYKPRQ